MLFCKHSSSTPLGLCRPAPAPPTTVQHAKHTQRCPSTGGGSAGTAHIWRKPWPSACRMSMSPPAMVTSATRYGAYSRTCTNGESRTLRRVVGWTAATSRPRTHGSSALQEAGTPPLPAPRPRAQSCPTTCAAGRSCAAACSAASRTCAPPTCEQCWGGQAHDNSHRQGVVAEPSGGVWPTWSTLPPHQIATGQAISARPAMPPRVAPTVVAVELPIVCRWGEALQGGRQAGVVSGGGGGGAGSAGAWAAHSVQ